jgi:hypothetical protein
MRYIINEKQYDIILESISKKNKFFQKYIDKAFDSIIMDCEQDNDGYNYFCNMLDTIENIQVVDIELIKEKDSQNKMYNVKLNVIYHSLREIYDFDELIYSLDYYLRKENIPVNLIINDSVNKSTFKDW